jgi:hypothetical protein
MQHVACFLIPGTKNAHFRHLASPPGLIARCSARWGGRCGSPKQENEDFFEKKRE